MAKLKPRPVKAQSRSPIPATGLIRHIPGKGLTVSTSPGPFPETVMEKVTCAKHIIQAVRASHDSGALEGENFDIHWPLSLAIELMEQANSQLDQEDTARAVARNRRRQAAAVAKGGAA